MFGVLPGNLSSVREQWLQLSPPKNARNVKASPSWSTSTSSAALLLCFLIWAHFTSFPFTSASGLFESPKIHVVGSGNTSVISFQNATHIVVFKNHCRVDCVALQCFVSSHVVPGLARTRESINKCIEHLRGFTNYSIVTECSGQVKPRLTECLEPFEIRRHTSTPWARNWLTSFINRRLTDHFISRYWLTVDGYFPEDYECCTTGHLPTWLKRPQRLE